MGVPDTSSTRLQGSPRIEASEPGSGYDRGMTTGPDITRIAALLGDAGRANMLQALMGGQALTAGELAREAGVTPQTASSTWPSWKSAA